MKTRIIDADSHVLEPRNLWRNYLEPEYKDRALRLEKDERGWERWLVDGKPYYYRHGVFGDMGAIGKELKRYFTPGEVTYDEGKALSPGGWDPDARIKVLDQEGIDSVILYPSLEITWEPSCADKELATAYCRAYNRWVVEWCSSQPDRLIPIAHVSLIDPAGAAEELERAVKEGCRGAVILGYPPVKRPYGHPANDVFWAVAQDLDAPVALHIGAAQRMNGGELFDVEFGPTTWWIYVNFMTQVQLGLTLLFQGAVFERFPRLKVAALETGCGWIPYWLERMDDTFDHTGFSTDLKLHPSEYFKRQCLITMDADEELALNAILHVGAQSFMWAADYPHSDGHRNAVKDVNRALRGVSKEDRNKVLGENAVQVYHLSTVVGSTV